MFGYAKQEGGMIRVYDERGRFMWWKCGKLVSCTSSLLIVEQGGFITGYNPKGDIVMVG